MPNKWTKTRILLPEGHGLTQTERKSLAQEIINFIEHRALFENKGYDPATNMAKRFPRYTEKYAKRKGSRSVDLHLSGKMFDDITLLANTSKSVTIGATRSQEKKVEGNQRGTYGQKSPIPGKARPFLGLSKTSLATLIRMIKKDAKDSGAKA